MRPTFGYISVEDDNEAEIERLHEDLTAFAVAEGLRLEEIFVDRNIRPTRLVRPGLDMVLSHVRQTGAVVLVPSEMHMSTWSVVREAIVAEVKSLGGAVMVAGSAGSSLHAGG
ncbi:recombinase family protein [Frankia sp. Cr2]|uniref:recombinase family protein n=1 Tax=Frankia sp. Cr2 TaxID=3073932 RepID=UPI002AD30364|nr:recombinase family protein [Frankia sp. Cr2]